MRTREKFDTEQIKVLEKALEESHHKEDKKMMRILIEYMKGKSTKEILDEYGISKSKLFRLRNSYKEDGLEGIIEIRRGPKNKLHREEMEQLQEGIKEFQESPKSWKEGNLKAKDIKEYIEEYCDTEISLRTCQRLLYTQNENLLGLDDKGIYEWVNSSMEKISFFKALHIWKIKAFKNIEYSLGRRNSGYSVLYLLYTPTLNLIQYAIGNNDNEEEHNRFFIGAYEDNKLKRGQVVWLDNNEKNMPRYCYVGVKTFYTINNKYWLLLIEENEKIKSFYRIIEAIKELSEQVESIEGYEKIPYTSQKNFIIEVIEDEIKEEKLNVKRVSI